MRHPLPAQRMAGPMGRGGMPNRFPIRNTNQVSWCMNVVGVQVDKTFFCVSP